MEQGNVNLTNDSLASSDANYEAEDVPVKERCWEQREALPGEPCCVNCGRYGEYICDETDDDICSIECKKAVLTEIANRQRWNASLPQPRIRLPASDECFYVRDNNGSGSQCITSSQIETLRNKIDIRVKGDSVPAPILSFSSSNLPQKLEQNLEAAGYEIPTPVQMQTIPAALVSKNLLVSAETGSGKTASFLIPVVSRCVYIRQQNHADNKKPLAMVLAPTRELCSQVEEEAKVLGKGLPFKTALVVGGDAIATQVYRIQKGVELIVGTPGRLIDLLSKHEIELDEISILVLDEVDCMLQRGFRDQVMQIFRALSHPQLLMFSATISREVEKMASSMVQNLMYVWAGKPSTPSNSVKQVVIWVESKHKKPKLFEILLSKQHFKPPAVVFVSSRLGADLLSEAITVTTGLKALPIHGEKGMKERRESLRLFLLGEVPVIVSTGVLGRGVDLLKVRQVIIFDMPNSMEEYIHQVGRASRMGVEGMAFVFVNEEDRKLFKELVQNLKSVGAAIPRELSNSHYLSGTYSFSGRQKRRKFGSYVVSSQWDSRTNSQLSLSSFSSDLQTCGLCSKLLKERAPWKGNEISIAAVLVCGHVYHAECLESATPEASKFDPSCPTCSYGESSAGNSLVKAGSKTRNKISRRAVADIDVDGKFMFERQKSESCILKDPRLGVSSSGKSSFGRSFLRRHFSFGSCSIKSAPGRECPRKKELWVRYR